MNLLIRAGMRQRKSPFWRRGGAEGLAVMSAPLVVAVVLVAAPAHADAQSYLNHLHTVGIHDVDGDAALLQQGEKLCDEMWGGASPGQLAMLALQSSDSRLGSRGLTPQQADDLVNFARADLCPNY